MTGRQFRKVPEMAASTGDHLIALGIDSLLNVDPDHPVQRAMPGEDILRRARRL